MTPKSPKTKEVHSLLMLYGYWGLAVALFHMVLTLISKVICNIAGYRNKAKEQGRVIHWFLKILLRGGMSLLLPSPWLKQGTWLCMSPHTFLGGPLIWVTLTQFTMRHWSLSHRVDGQKVGWPKLSKGHFWPQVTLHVYPTVLYLFLHHKLKPIGNLDFDRLTLFLQELGY